MKHFSIFGFLLLQISRPDTGDREGHVVRMPYDRVAAELNNKVPENGI